MTYASQLARNQEIAGKVARVFQKRAQIAQQQIAERKADDGTTADDRRILR